MHYRSKIIVLVLLLVLFLVGLTTICFELNDQTFPTAHAAANSPEIKLTKSADQPSAKSGDHLVYTLTYQNNGLDHTKNMIVKDFIPQGVAYVLNSATNNGIYRPLERSLYWQIGSVSPGQSGILKFEVIVGGEDPTLANTKDLSKYTSKEIFLVSDQTWQDVMNLVPVAVWTGTDDFIHTYPTLIYHLESSGAFDADSILYFMEQYSPDKVTALGSLPSELVGLIQAHGLTPAIIGINDLLSYWTYYQDVVYVQNDYASSLMASIYASLINAPLIIQHSSSDVANVFTGKNIICVGNVSPASATCNKNYSLEQLQQEYVNQTKTDKIVLVNPNDLQIKISETFQPKKSARPINEIYSRHSLAAPILASAKHEIIISTTATDYQTVDSFIETKINQLKIPAEYLTIVASPNAVEMSYVGFSSDYEINYWSADSRYYARLNNDAFIDLAVGRIFSLTSSDVSSNIARSVFYKETLKNEDKILSTRGSPHITSAAEVYAVGKILSSIGYNVQTTPSGTSADDWQDKLFINYLDHGGIDWAGIGTPQIPDLDNAFVATMACLTCDFTEASNKQDLFCANIIRKGGVGYIGATDTTGYLNTQAILNELFTYQSTIGQAFLNSKNSAAVLDAHMNPEDDKLDTMANYDIMPNYVLIGDPTLKLNIIHSMPQPQLTFLEDVADGRNYRLVIPAMKINIPEDIKNMCQAPNQVVPVSFPTAYNRQFDIKYVFSTKFPGMSNFSPVAVSDNTQQSHTWLDKQEDDYLWLTFHNNHLSEYFSTANDQSFTDFEFNITLFDQAPDFSIENITLNDRLITFDVKNIGNKRGVAQSGEGMFWVIVRGCISPTCHESDNYYYFNADTFQNTSFDLDIGQVKNFSVTCPEFNNGYGFHDSQYIKYKVIISLGFPLTFVEQRYGNNRDVEVNFPTVSK